MVSYMGLQMQESIDDSTDGRPDYAPYSSNFRMEVSSTSAFDHVASLISPQAFIVDNAAIEESYMLKAVRGVAREKGKALIELPFNANEGLEWITRLDSGSLSCKLPAVYQISDILTMYESVEQCFC